MWGSDAQNCEQPEEEPVPDDVQPTGQPEDGQASCRTPPQTLRDEVWEAFELDEDSLEPQPEYGDFWGELDEDEAV